MFREQAQNGRKSVFPSLQFFGAGHYYQVLIKRVLLRGRILAVIES